MIRRILRSRNLVALILPLALVSAAFAGGADCDHGKATAAGKGSHCNLNKNVAKDMKITDDGAVVTLHGKTPEAVEHIKAHLTAHNQGEACEGCPLSMDGVKASFKIDNDGGVIEAHGSTPETIKAVQEWAKKPAGACCNEKGHAKDKA